MILIYRNYVLIVLILFNFISISLSLQAVIKGGLTKCIDVKPGEIIPMKLELVNNSDKAQEFIITPADYLYNANGSEEYPKPGTLPRSNASWIKLHTNHITIPPKGEGSVMYLLKVPDTTNLLAQVHRAFEQFFLFL